MEEKKNNKGLMIGIIIFLIICLILVFYFMFKMVYKEQSNNSTNEASNTEKGNSSNNIEILNLDNLLKLVPVKINNGTFSSYKTEDLTDLEINDSLCLYIYNNEEKKIVNNGYLLEKNKSGDVLIKFLNLNNYQINTKAGNSDIRFKLEESSENGIDYYKLNLTNAPTDNFETYEYKNMNSVDYNNDKNIYIVKTEVIYYTGGGPSLRIGTADICLKYENSNYVLDEVIFQRYDETIIESN